MLEENVFIPFFKKFDQYPFRVKINRKEYKIGNGEPEFTVNFKKPVSLPSLMTSTSLALGEAYMDGDLEVEGDLYYALDHFLGQMGQFSTDESALKKIMFPSSAKKNQQKEVQSHYDIGNDFYRLWLNVMPIPWIPYFFAASISKNPQPQPTSSKDIPSFR